MVFNGSACVFVKAVWSKQRKHFCCVRANLVMISAMQNQLIIRSTTSVVSGVGETSFIFGLMLSNCKEEV
jgi:hypothetical protein